MLSFSKRRWASGLASLDKSNLIRHIESGYVERCIGSERDQLPERVEDYIISEYVRTMTFDSLLDKYRFESIDLLQIDAEGYDYRLLMSFDFDRIRPSILHFERHHMKPEEWDSLLQHLRTEGYFCFADGINAVGLQENLADALALRFEVRNLTAYTDSGHASIWRTPRIRRLS